ncbi:MAG: hypothetical protein AAF617_03845 [Bacteroidota bacterium]
MKLEENIPFIIKSAFSQAWTGGQPDSGSGINVHITIQELNKAKIELKYFYFRAQKTILEENTHNNDGLYIARFIKLATKDVILHKDSQKEAANEPPQLNFPFDLQKNEGVISYLEEGKLTYYKLENIVEKFPNHYPNMPQNK